MFLSHRSSVRLGSTRLFRPSRSSLLSVSPRLRHSVRASVFIPFNHCVMPFACRASVQASLPKPNQPSVRLSSSSSLSIRPSLRLGKALKAARPWEAWHERGRTDFTLLLCRLNIWIGGGSNYRASQRTNVPGPPGGKHEGERKGEEEEKKTLS